MPLDTRLLPTQFPLMLFSLLSAGLWLAPNAARADETEQPAMKVWSGTWTNRK